MIEIYGNPTGQPDFHSMSPLATSRLPGNGVTFNDGYVPSTQRAASSLGYSATFNASAILVAREQYQIQVIATTFSSVTIAASICAVYWFCMMRRNFRRDLILLLIAGDVWKSLWFLVFAATTLSRGHIPTKSPFCQASGYLLQTGLESCDVAIFMISLHMALQIFPPKSTFLGNDGLYRARYFVYAAWVLLPNLSASLAFINDEPAGYVSQGGFCSLPIRPFWYRLALSWIPRYLVWVFVMCVALRIYFHVGYDFRVFANEQDQTSSTGIPGEVCTVPHLASSNTATAMARTTSTQSDAAGLEKHTRDDGTSASDEELSSADPKLVEPARSFLFRLGRRQSVPNWRSPFNDSPVTMTQEGSTLSGGSRSMPSSRRGSKQLAPVPGKPEPGAPLDPLDLSIARVSFNPTWAANTQASEDLISPTLEPITEYKTYPATVSQPPGHSASNTMYERRPAIQRQLRVLFIYPVVYLIFWIIPFVSHCFNYSNYYAQHPVFALSCLNVFCQTFMGFADVCIFCWRERPWRHIPGSDGTLLGSFMFWRFASNLENARRQSVVINSVMATAGDRTQSSTMHTASRANSHASFLNTIKHWRLSAVSSIGVGDGETSPHGSIAHAHPAPSSPRRPVSLAHRRAFSGGHSDRRVRAAELAHERLALERADWALQHQQRQRTADAERQTSAISTIQSERKEPERKEWWERQMSWDDISTRDEDDP